jgi:hypothetical protein
MTAIRVIPVDVLSDVLARLMNRFIGSQVNAPVLHRSSGPRDHLPALNNPVLVSAD